MIEIKNIKKSYGNLEVLKGINLTIPENKIITIVGASGAGKSTLLHILGTLDTPDCGEIWYDRENIATYSSNKLATFRNNNIGFVFQFHHLLPEFTALENVCMPAWIKMAFKPVATIMTEQETVTKEGEEVRFQAHGRHDPCVVPRAVPVVEAMAAMTVLDLLLENEAGKRTGDVFSV